MQMYKLASYPEPIRFRSQRNKPDRVVKTELGVGPNLTGQAPDNVVDLSQITAESFEASLERDYPTTRNGILAFLFLIALSTAFTVAIFSFIVKSLHLI